MKTKVLLIDDEPSIITLLEYNLEMAGFQIITATDGIEGLKLAISEAPDIIILDVMLPQLDGMEVCRQLRQDKIMTPIIMISAKDEEINKILGLEFGADDYIVKPFSTREVVSRVKAVLRRAKPPLEAANENDMEDKQIIIGEITIYPSNFEVYFQDNLLELTLKEFELLFYLAQNKGRVVSREQLLSAVWKNDYSCGTRIVDVHISHIREKLGEKNKSAYIKTYRAIGYKLDDPLIK
ncbi:response regulator transcription factor [Bacillus rubiinfantis]|uniref:response regulator transcription factor n=1 Tax=Bacillus rubiinfantis TaxID=1499680 RepID=UPI0005AAF88D|nr:response regulator transcription factor [Bacillus rubiinfantis]